MTATAQLPEGYTVEREEYDGAPCEHPMCAKLHRRFYTGTEEGTETVEYPSGRTETVRVRGSHSKKVVEWVILLDGRRVGSAHDTKRDAVAEALTRPEV